MSAEPVARRCPIQNDHRTWWGHCDVPGPSSVSWLDAAHAWRAYHAIYPNDQTLDIIAQRGGFSWKEYLGLRAVARYMDAHPRASRDELSLLLDAAFIEMSDRA